MAKELIRIGCGAGFWGDNLDAPQRLAAAGLDYLTLEYLAELTLSILTAQHAKDPQAGFATDFLDVLQSLLPALQSQPDLKIITNAGGKNPQACARRAAALLEAAGLGGAKIGVVSGDDLLPRLAELQSQGVGFENLDTGQALSTLQQPVASAHVYLGAAPIAAALADDARIVITGRVADASLTLGPAAHEFGWVWDDWDRLAGGSVAGHLIECGAQVTGGYRDAWQGLDLANVGYPIAEVAPDGSCTIAKPAGSGGAVTRATVAEQLVYEIGDPAHYLTPDVDVDFTTVGLEETGPDRVFVRGARGNPAPRTLKASLAYRDGYTASGQLLVFGQDCLARADACAQMLFDRVARAGFKLERTNVERLGAGDGVPGCCSPPADLREVVLRISVWDRRAAAIERFTKELAPLITSGPAGLAGYAAARAAVRPVFAYWPALVPRELVQPKTETRTAQQWLG